MTASTIGSLFTGYGGIDLALHDLLGAETAWVSDIDKGANAILEHRFPGVPNIGDITTIDWDTVPRVDILTGGFPCQDLSHAGKRAGLRPDTRSGLWLHMAHAIDQLRPSLVIAENVRGLLSAQTAESERVETVGPKGGRKVGHTERALGRVLSDLADLGYDATWCGLRASEVGASHGRFRVFLVATPQDADGAVGGERRIAAPGEAEGWRAWSDTGGRSGAPDSSLTLLPTPAVNDMGEGKTVEHWDKWTAKMKAAHGNGNGHGKSLAIEALRLLPTPRSSDGEKGGPNQRGSKGHPALPAAVVHLLPTPTTANSHGNEENSRGDRLLPGVVVDLLPTPTAADSGASGGAVGSSNVTLTDATTRGASRGIDFGQYAAAVARQEAAFGSLAPSPTEPTGRGGSERLSPLFVEWMMGLPAGHVTGVPGLSRAQMLKALGNGVVPQQAYAALSHIFQQIGVC